MLSDQSTEPACAECVHVWCIQRRAVVKLEDEAAALRSRLKEAEAELFTARARLRDGDAKNALAPRGRWIIDTGLPPVLMPSYDEDEEDALIPFGKAYVYEGEDIVAVFADVETARRVVAAMNPAPAAAPAPPAVPGDELHMCSAPGCQHTPGASGLCSCCEPRVPLPAVPPSSIARAICTHPGIDNDGKCQTCGDEVALAVPVEFARRLAEIDRLAASPPAVPEKSPMTLRLEAAREIPCPTCDAKAGEWCDGMLPDSTAICITRQRAAGTGRAPTGGGR